MSSAATLSVALDGARKSKVLRRDMVDFGIPLFANIHLCGSVLTEVFFCMTISKMLYGQIPGPGTMILFCLLLGIFAIGAPGVPGGTVMASLGLIIGVLGFDDAGTALMLAIFALQDSFGTACNVTGDGALTLFLTGVNVGFMPVGHFLGKSLAGSDYRWILIPVGMVMGWFVVSAEPAVAVLNQQVYEMTAGAVPPKALSLSLSVGVSVSVGLSILRVLVGIPIMTLLIPGYLLAFLLMLFCPPVFTAIAFDSGGVASGPMTATFLLPLAIGACESVGGEAAAEAFGVVALVAMTPLLAIQILGIVFRIQNR